MQAARLRVVENSLSEAGLAGARSMSPSISATPQPGDVLAPACSVVLPSASTPCFRVMSRFGCVPERQVAAAWAWDCARRLRVASGLLSGSLGGQVVEPAPAPQPPRPDISRQLSCRCTCAASPSAWTTMTPLLPARDQIARAKPAEQGGRRVILHQLLASDETMLVLRSRPPRPPCEILRLYCRSYSTRQHHD